jgi:hypothetical protein
MLLQNTLYLMVEKLYAVLLACIIFLVFDASKFFILHLHIFLYLFQPVPLSMCLSDVLLNLLLLEISLTWTVVLLQGAMEILINMLDRPVNILFIPSTRRFFYCIKAVVLCVKFTDQ